MARPDAVWPCKGGGQPLVALLWTSHRAPLHRYYLSQQSQRGCIPDGLKFSKFSQYVFLYPCGLVMSYSRTHQRLCTLGATNCRTRRFYVLKVHLIHVDPQGFHPPDNGIGIPENPSKTQPDIRQLRGAVMVLRFVDGFIVFSFPPSPAALLRFSHPSEFLLT